MTNEIKCHSRVSANLTSGIFSYMIDGADVAFQFQNKNGLEGYIGGP